MTRLGHRSPAQYGWPRARLCVGLSYITLHRTSREMMETRLALWTEGIENLQKSETQTK